MNEGTAALIEIAIAHHRSGRLTDAEALYRRVLAKESENARAMHLLGVIAHQAGRHLEALDFIRRSVALRPDAPDFHNNLGNVLAAIGNKAEAESAFRSALCLQPDYPDAVINLANALREQGRLEESADACRSALSRWPQNPEAHNALGAALERTGQVRQAVSCFDSAVRLRPDYVQAHKNRAMALLMLGDFERGWPEYEWRLREPGAQNSRRWPSRTPRWDGSQAGISGKTLLLHTEGGLGNVIQFSRYATLLASRGVRVALECPRPLKRLLGTLDGTHPIVSAGEPLPHFDVHCSIVSLPALLGTTLDSVPAEVPYLKADPELVEHYRRLIAADEQLRCSFLVGICWQGNPKFPNDAIRSIPLKHFAPLAGLPRIRLISLQHGAGNEQLRSAGFSVTELTGPPEPADAAFLNTAAVMKNLDLVITSDTSIAHLAGALAVPVWVALSATACWRWMRDRQDSPWYPTMRLFRQRTLGQWGGVLDEIAASVPTCRAKTERGRFELP
jgi:Flp pilus assembly protein TadD